MVQRIDVSIHIAVAAGADVGRIALRGAGRCRDDILVSVHMRKHRNDLRLGRTAARAGKGLDAGLGFGGRLGHFAIIPTMIEGRNLAGKSLAAIRFGTGTRLRASLGAGGLFFSCPFTEVMNGCIFGNGFIFAFNRHFLPCIFRAKKVNIFQAVTAAKRSASNRRHSVRDGDLRQIGAIGKCEIIDACYTVRNGIPHV